MFYQLDSMGTLIEAERSTEMRAKYKVWRNDKGGKWTRRISWFQNAEGTDIRLHLENENGEWNLFPKDRAEADSIWVNFKNGVDVNQPFST